MIYHRIVVWDSAAEPYPGLFDKDTLIIRWSGFSTQEKNDISLITEIEKNSDATKYAYVEFVDGLYYKKGLNEFLDQKLKSPTGHNLWWMSLINEKSPFRNSAVLNCLKLIAFKKVLGQIQFKLVEVYSADSKVLKSLQAFFRELEVDILLIKTKSNQSRLSDIKKFVTCLPQMIQGMVYLARYTINRLGLKAKKIPEIDHVKNILVSNLYNLDSQELSQNKIRLKQLEDLPHLLGESVIYFNHLINSPQIPNSKVAQQIIDNCDKDNQHLMIDSFFDFQILAQVFTLLIKTNLNRLRLVNKKSYFFLNSKSKVNFYFFLEDDFLSSLFGSAFVMNQIWDLLFNKISVSIKDFSGSILYLCENQGWERALIYSARKNVIKSKIVAIPHSTVRYWDIKYNFTDQGFKNKNQIADFYTLNGPPAMREFEISGYDKNKLVEVEALRYQYLLKYKEKNQTKARTNKILFLGDFSKETTLKIFDVIYKKMSDFKKQGLSLHYKPHPFCPDILIEDHDIKTVKGSLSDIIDQYDAVIISNSTSACLDAYIGGLRVIIFLDENDVNHSPMRGSLDVQFVTYADFNKMEFNFSSNYNPSEQYFWLSKDYGRWFKFINRLKV